MVAIRQDNRNACPVCGRRIRALDFAPCQGCSAKLSQDGFIIVGHVGTQWFWDEQTKRWTKVI